MIQPPLVIFTSQPGVLTGSTQVFVASSNGSSVRPGTTSETISLRDPIAGHYRLIAAAAAGATA